MRLSRRVSVLERREDRRLSNLRTRKKHKRLDAICENVYNQNRKSVRTGLYGGEGDETELRRSTRVRRAPVMLDASPSPAKKRRRIEFRSGADPVARENRKEGVKNDSFCSTSGNLVQESDCWGNRLRARVRNGSFRHKQEEFSLSRGKRRLFRKIHEVVDEVKVEDLESSDCEELDCVKSTVVKSTRPGRIKASNVSKNIHRESESSSDEHCASESNEGEEDTVKIEVQSDEDKDESKEHDEKHDAGLLADRKQNEDEDNEGKDTSEDDKNENKAEEHNETDEVGMPDNIEKNKGDRGKNEAGIHEIEDILKVSDQQNQLHFDNDVEVGDGSAAQVAEKQAEDAAITLQSEDSVDDDSLETMGTYVKVELPRSVVGEENNGDFVQGISADQMKDGRHRRKPSDRIATASLCDRNGKLHLRVGRRCGLCGTGTDGKPPKRLVEDGIGSDNEAYSGSSASEDVKYDTCDGFGDELGWLGRLLGPINDRYGIAGIWVHQHCAVWSPEVYFAGLGCLKNVRAALCRGRALKCTRCQRAGATIGCRVDRCPKTYHLPCARAIGCIFDHRKFLIACTDHRHLFQPHGSQYLDMIKKMKVRKMKLEMRKVSGDALRKDLEAEEKWLENCGEDEEFLRRESRRLHRDLLRIAPVYIGGSNSDNETQFQGWESVAGLQHVIQSLKEVVILPLLYPEFFSNMGLTPPRGVLLHGYPGTGKTLVVRALLGSCSHGDKRIAYFARKGADCLGKYVGDAERQLRLLFQVAEKSQPSIIFFDEIDGLAPCRTRQQDQTHISVVSTLLALLDGLKSRGSVVVIGATNRPDAVDSALRRPGRFDREIYFPLPSVQDREAILSLHTRKWPKPVTGLVLKQIARRTMGFAGADLQSLCTQAAITALKRSCPLQKILSAAEKRTPSGKQPLPTFAVEERDWLEALRHVPPPCSQRGAEMAANDVVSSALNYHLVPCLLQPLSAFVVSLYRDERILLPPSLYKAAMLVRDALVSALDRKKLPSDIWWSHAHDVLQEADVLMDIEIKLLHCGIIIGHASDPDSGIGDVDSNNGKLEFNCLKVQQVSACQSLQHNVTCASEKNLGFWLLIAGSPRSGQRYLASCLLHCFTGNLEIQKVDMATICQEGQGDLAQGITRILMKCTRVGSCVLFMPRIDLWAVETASQLYENGSDSSKENLEIPVHKEGELSEMAASEDNVLVETSYIWNLFVEQVESIAVSMPLTILATSELPVEALPDRISELFNSEKSDCRTSSSLEQSIPRFSVHLDGHFNRDRVINSSAIELSDNLVQQFIQSNHQRLHVQSSPRTEVKDCDILDSNTNNHTPAYDDERAKCHEGTLAKLSSPPNNRPSRGKSNLFLSISMLGYQILRYPHFAELCWVTSKLKDGPCTDTKGPWKGWPFNSCIVRPYNSPEQVAVACSSSNVKSKEKWGLARGLIAVGLLAYRGAYTTLREVSSEVRKVLELLADEINAKICAGKDSYQYIRLLSQMAFFEDVVNSWAYSLQSLEDDALMTIPSRSTDLKTPDYLMPPVDNPEHKVGGEPIAFTSSDGGLGKCTRNYDLNRTAGPCDPEFAGKIVAEKPPEQKALHTPTSYVYEQDRNNPNACTSENPGTHLSDGGHLGSMKCNGFATTDSLIIEEDGPCSGDTGNTKSSSFEELHDQHNDSTMRRDITAENGKLCSDGRCETESSSSDRSGIICFYHCCSECLIKLRETIRKILIQEWGSRDGGGFKVEDVHDLVVSLSVSLHSALRRMLNAQNWPMSVEEKTSQANFGDLFGYQGKNPCLCKDPKAGLRVMMECGSHSGVNLLSQDSRCGSDLKFICRDGLVTMEDPDKEVTCLNFHCKFESLCLGSLVEWLVMTRQPSL